MFILTSATSLTAWSQITAPTQITGNDVICIGQTSTYTASGGTGGDDRLYMSTGSCPQVAYFNEFSSFNGTYGGTGSSTANNFGNFHENSGDPTTAASNADGNLVVHTGSGASDPYYLMSGLGSFNPNTYKYIKVRYRVTSGTAGNAQIFFLNTEYPGANAAQEVDAPLNSDGEWHVVTFNMASHSKWTKSNVTGWRFDWCTNGNVDMEIDYIALTQFNDPQYPLTITPTSPTPVTIYANRLGSSDPCLQKTVTVLGNPQVTLNDISASATAVCPGEEVTLTASTASSQGTVSYFWSELSSTEASVSVNPSSTQTYVVNATATECGLSATDSKEIAIEVIKANAGGNDFGCSRSLSLKAQPQSSFTGTATWSSDAADVTFSDAHSPSSAITISDDATLPAVRDVVWTYEGGQCPTSSDQVRVIFHPCDANDCYATGTIIFSDDFGGNNPADPTYSPSGLPGNYTTSLDYLYSPTGVRCIPGQVITYGIYSLVKKGLTNSDWISPSDHTYPDDFTHGYFMEIDGHGENQLPEGAVDTFYRYKVENLCPNTLLYFSFWLIGINDRSTHTTAGADLTLEIRSLEGELLQSESTGLYGEGMWAKFGMVFPTPDNEDAVEFLLINNHNVESGNDFGLDDIEIRLCAPEAKAEIDGDTVICYGDDVTLDGTYEDDGTFLDHKQRWFKSTDGENWTAIADATTLDYTVTNLQEDTYFQLAVSATQEDADNPISNCRALSNIVFVEVRDEFDAGAIAAGVHQTICQYATATAFGNADSASGGDNKIVYRWQSSKNNGASWSNISNTNGATYTPGSEFTSVGGDYLFRRQAHDSTCVADFVTSDNVDTLTVIDPYVELENLSATATTICKSDEVTISSELDSLKGDVTYLWSNGDITEDITVNPTATGTYTVTATATIGSCTVTDSKSITITVYPDFTAGAIEGGSETICKNGTATAIGSATAASGGNNNINYRWQVSTNGGSTYSDIEINSATYTPGTTYTGTAGTYTFRRQAHDGACNTSWTSSTGTYTLTVNDPQVVASITEPTETSVCKNASVTLEANVASYTGTLSYKWSNDAPTSSITVNPTTTTTYTLTVTATQTPCTAEDVDNITITVYDDFNAGTIASTGETICKGETASTIGSTTAASGGDGNITYKWQVSSNNGTSYTDIASSNTPTLTPGTAYTNSRGTYIFKRLAKDGSCQSDFTASTNTYTLTVYAPSVTLTSVTANPTSICSGGSSTLTATPGTHVGDLTYAWSSGLTGSVSTGSVSPTSTTTYTVTVTATDGSCTATASKAVTVTVYDDFDAGEIETDTKEICINGTAPTIGSTTAASGGDGTVIYSWYEGSNLIAGATSATYQPGSTYTGTAGTYVFTRKAYDNNCESSPIASTGSYTLKVLDPAITLNAISASKNELCNGETGTLTASAASSTGTVTYKWSTDEETASIDVTTAGTYTVTATATLGTGGICKKTDVKSVSITTQNASVTMTGVTANPAEICNGESTTLTPQVTASQGTLTYAWSNTASTSTITVDPTSTTTYTVTVTATAGGCTATATKSQEVTVHDLPTDGITSNSEMCVSTSEALSELTLTGPTGMTNYTWTATGATVVSGGTTSDNTITVSYASTGSKTVTLTYTDDNGCSPASSASKSITVNAAPTVAVSAYNGCPNQSSYDVTATVTNGATPYTYSWTGATGTDENATITRVGTTDCGHTYNYSVAATDDNGCKKTGSNSFTVNDETNPTLALTMTNQMLTSTNCVFTVPDLTTSTYIQTATDNCGTPTLSQSVAAGTPITENTTVTITLTDGCGNTDAKSILLKVPDPITASISKTDALCYDGTTGTATVSNVAGGNGTYTYKWSTSPQQTTATATDLHAGSYTATVTDGNGCEITKSITVSEPDQLVLALDTTRESCTGNDGAITATVTGGTSPMTFTWNPGTTVNGTTTSTGSTYTYTGLTSIDGPNYGHYAVTVTDAHNCTVSGDTTITLYNPLHLNTVTIPPFCSGYTFSYTPENGTDGVILDGTVYSWPAATCPEGVTGPGAATGAEHISGTFTNTTGEPVSVSLYVTPNAGVCYGDAATTQIIVNTTTNPQVSITGFPDDMDKCHNADDVTINVEYGEVNSTHTDTWSVNGNQVKQTANRAQTVNTDSYVFDIPNDYCDSTYTIRFAYVDESGCEASKEVNVHVKIPTWSVGTNGSKTIQCLADVVVPTATDPSVMPSNVKDGCDNVLTPVLKSTVYTPSTITCEGSVVYTYRYTACDDSYKDWTYTYTIERSTAPTIASTGIENSKTVNCVSAATAPTTIPDATDVCGNDITPEMSVIDSPNPLTCSGTRIYRYTYTDCADLSSTWDYTYTVNDNVKPVIDATVVTEIAANVSGCDYTIPDLRDLVRAHATDNCTTNANELTITQNPAQNSAITMSDDAQDITVTVTVTDKCSNSETTDVTVTVPAQLKLQITDYNSQCYNTSDGYIDVTVSGGTPGYTIDWGSSHSMSAAGNYTIEDLADGTYTVKVTDSKGCEKSENVTIAQIADALTITANDHTWTYDGNAHSDNGYSIAFGSQSEDGTSGTGLTLSNGDVLTVSITGSITNYSQNDVDNVVGTPTIMRGTDDVTCYYNIVKENGALHINQDATPIVVYITGNTGTFDYDGNPHTVTGYETSCENTLYNTHLTDNFSFTGDSTVTRTEVGHSDMGLEATQFSNTNTNFSNVTFVVVDGGITLKDDERPTLTCPDAITGVQCISVLPDHFTSYTEFVAAGGTAADNNAINTSSFTWVSDVSDNNSCPEVITRKYYIEDNSGNDTTCKQTITVKDETKPKVTGAPTSVNASHVDCAYTMPDLRDTVRNHASDNCTATTALTITQDETPGSTITLTSSEQHIDVTLTVTDECGNDSVVVITVDVPAALSASISNQTQESCTGNDATATVTATGGTAPYTYEWSTTPTQTAATATTLTTTKTNHGAYTVTVTDDHNCTATANVTVSLNNPVVLNDLTIPAKCSTLEFDYTPESGTDGTLPSPTYYTWSAPTSQPAGVSGPDAGTNQTSIHGTITNTSNAAYTYDLQVRPIHGICRGAVANVTVISYPEVTATVDATLSTCPNAGTKDIEVTYTNINIAHTSKWYIDDVLKATNSGAATETEDTYTYSVPTTPCSKDYVYKVEYSDAAGCTATDHGTLTVEIPTWSITAAPGKDTVECLADVVAPTTITPSVMPTVKDGCDQELTTPELISTIYVPASIACEGSVEYTYRYTACDDTYDDWTYTYTIERSTAPVVATGFKDKDTVACLSLVAAPTNVPTATDVCGNELIGVKSVIDNPSPLSCSGTRTYRYTYTDCANQTATWDYVVVVNDSIDPTIATDVITTKAADVSGCDYSIPDLRELIRAYCSDNCTTDNADLTITQSPAENSAITLTSTAQSIPVTVTVEDKCGNTSTTVVDVTAPAGLTVSITGAGGASSICHGGEIDLTAVTTGGRPSYTYKWSTTEETETIHVAPTSTTTYSVTVTDQNNCTEQALFALTVSDIADATIVGDASVCAGGSTDLSVSSAPAGSTYAWSTLESTPTITVTPTTPTTYSVTVTAPGGCVSTGSHTVDFNAQPTITITDPGMICPNIGTQTLTATISSGTTPYTVTWDGDLFAAPETTTGITGTTTTVDVTIPTDCDKTYDIEAELEDDKGCTATATLQLVVNDVTKPTFTAPADTTLCRNTTNGDIEADPSVTGIMRDTADNCSSVAEMTASWQDIDTTGNDAEVRVIHRQWKLVDGCGNMETKIQNISIRPSIMTDGNVTIKCSNDTTVVLNYGDCDTAVLIFEPEVFNAMSGMNVTISNNAPINHRYSVGTTPVIWTIEDECGAKKYCYQDVTIAYPPCGTPADSVDDADGNRYSSVRIGCHCWTGENARTDHYSSLLSRAAGTEIPVRYKYRNSDSLFNIYGYLYTWYSVVKVPEGDDAAVPARNSHNRIQGICPDGWAVPTQEEYLDMIYHSGDAWHAKEASTLYWQPGREGITPSSDFDARGGGFRDGSTGYFENLMLESHFWTETLGGTGSGTNVIEVVFSNCESEECRERSKGNGYSVRCIRIY